jgi:hypothetical protein
VYNPMGIDTTLQYGGSRCDPTYWYVLVVRRSMLSYWYYLLPVCMALYVVATSRVSRHYFCPSVVYRDFSMQTPNVLMNLHASSSRCRLILKARSPMAKVVDLQIPQRCFQIGHTRHGTSIQVEVMGQMQHQNVLNNGRIRFLQFLLQMVIRKGCRGTRV